MRILWASLSSGLIASVLNPAFDSIAVLFLLLIPVLMIELYFHQPVNYPAPKPVPKHDKNSSPKHSV